MKNAVLLLTFMVLLVACAEEKIMGDSYAIKYGTECGWCGGQEYLTLTETAINYHRNIPCGENKGVINKSRDLKTGEWDSINNSFDYELFKTLDYNECNVCVDGCDELIEITKDNSVHQIRYSFDDQVEGMELLRQKLTEIIEEMRNG